MARQSAWHDGTSDDQSALQLASARRWSWRRSTIKRIKNRDAWEIGLAGLPDAQEARNVVFSDATVRAFVAAAYGTITSLGC